MSLITVTTHFGIVDIPRVHKNQVWFKGGEGGARGAIGATGLLAISNHSFSLFQSTIPSASVVTLDMTDMESVSYKETVVVTIHVVETAVKNVEGYGPTRCTRQVTYHHHHHHLEII